MWVQSNNAWCLTGCYYLVGVMNLFSLRSEGTLVLIIPLIGFYEERYENGNGFMEMFAQSLVSIRMIIATIHIWIWCFRLKTPSVIQPDTCMPLQLYCIEQYYSVMDLAFCFFFFMTSMETTGIPFESQCVSVLTK